MKRLIILLSLLTCSCVAAATEHPLQGTIWQISTRQPINRYELIALLHQYPYVVLGETHDNPVHHTLQTILTTAYVREHKGAVVAFEMLDLGQEATLRLALADHPRDAAPLGSALQWEKGGWPAWSHYQPIAQAALDHGARLEPANITRSQVRSVARGEPQPDLPLLPTLPPERVLDYQRDIAASHCHKLPESMLGGMMRVQQMRDAVMARAMGSGPSVLIAGSGHGRTDRGVPAFLPSGRSFSVAFIEVEDDRTRFDQYGADELPFDAVWFTERALRSDPCASLDRVRPTGSP